MAGLAGTVAISISVAGVASYADRLERTEHARQASRCQHLDRPPARRHAVAPADRRQGRSPLQGIRCRAAREGAASGAALAAQRTSGTGIGKLRGLETVQIYEALLRAEQHSETPATVPAWQPCLPEVVELYVYFRGDLPAIGLLAEPATLVEVTESSEAARLATGRFKTAELPDLVALSNVVAIQVPATRGGEVSLNDSALEIGTKTMRETP